MKACPQHFFLMIAACGVSCGQHGIVYEITSAQNQQSEKIHSIINESGNTIITRFNPPAGYVRQSLDSNSFGYYLRQLPLKEPQAVVHYHNGETKGEAIYDAVIDMDIGTRDLQQCADAVMRLRGEYFYATNAYEKISFTLTNGFRMDYSEWIKGNRLAVNGNTTHWSHSAASSNTYSDFRKFMDVVFSYAGTHSLSKSMQPKNMEDIEPGDVFIHSGFPGHAVIVVDVAVHKNGGKVFLIAQSFMPAQEIHILKNFTDGAISPWYTNTISELHSPQWSFPVSELKQFNR